MMLAACASSAAPLSNDLSLPTNEQDQARHTYDIAVARWEDQQPAAHVLTVGFDGVSELVIEFAVDGTVVSESLELGDPDGWEVERLPRSIADAFTEIDVLIRRFETGELAVPEDGECGHHLNARYDATLGNPVSYDTHGPCDDGIGLSLSVHMLP